MIQYIALSIAVALGLYVVATLLLGQRGARDSAPASSQDEYDRVERSRMPAEIANARLVISEKVFYRPGPRPYAAKTDQGFLTQDGWLVLVETKTRRRMSASDLVQISAQALAIAQSPKGGRWKVANWGYIRLAPVGGKPYYARVDLLHPTRIDQLWDRWLALKENRARPIARPKEYRCDNCELRRTCSSAVLKDRR